MTPITPCAALPRLHRQGRLPVRGGEVRPGETRCALSSPGVRPRLGTTCEFIWRSWTARWRTRKSGAVSEPRGDLRGADGPERARLRTPPLAPTSVPLRQGWLARAEARSASYDPDDPHFSLSFGGEAFFVVGLHPNAARPGRRFETPALVFNLHDQFDRLRANGVYDRLKATISARDIALAGSLNPMAQPFGQGLEASRRTRGGGRLAMPLQQKGRRSDGDGFRSGWA